MGTIAAKNQLALGRVVCRTFAEHHANVPAQMLLADEPGEWFDPAGEAFPVVPLQKLREQFGRVIEEIAQRYQQQALTYALTPFWISYLFRQGYDQVLFLKQESMVTGDLGPVMAQLEGASVLLTPHLLHPLREPAREQNILLCGTFNGGFIAFSRCKEAEEFLGWWQERMVHHCRFETTEGMHFEQRWLDLAPAYCAGARIVRDPGVNVGHWNLPERKITFAEGQLMAEGVPCRLFRFSGYDPAVPNQPTRYFQRLQLDELDAAAEVFAQYQKALLAAGWEETRHWPYSLGPNAPDRRAASAAR